MYDFVRFTAGKYKGALAQEEYDSFKEQAHFKKLAPEFAKFLESYEIGTYNLTGLKPMAQATAEKGWKDFYKDNRVQAMIDSTNYRLKARNVSEEDQKRLHESLKTPWKDLVEYQNLQSWGFISGLLTKGEAEMLYHIYGGDAPSPEKWDKLSLAEKVTATKMADELLSVKLKKAGYSPRTLPEIAKDVPLLSAQTKIPHRGTDPEAIKVAERLGLSFDGMQGDNYQFTVQRGPKGAEGITFYVEDLSQVEGRLKEKLEQFGLSSQTKPRKFPLQEASLKRLGDYKIIQEHDDGDLTIQVGNQMYVVTTDGEVFVHYTASEALKKILDDKGNGSGFNMQTVPHRKEDRVRIGDLKSGDRFQFYKDPEVFVITEPPREYTSWGKMAHYKAEEGGKPEKASVEVWVFRYDPEFMARCRRSAKTSVDQIEMPDSFTTKEQWEKWRADVIDRIYQKDKGHRWTKAQLEGFSVHELHNIHNFISRGKSAQNYPDEPERRPKQEGDLELLPDSPEFVAQTVQESGWRERLDQEFEAAVGRTRSRGR
jgi:hypothetical protein